MTYTAKRLDTIERLAVYDLYLVPRTDYAGRVNKVLVLGDWPCGMVGYPCLVSEVPHMIYQIGRWASRSPGRSKGSFWPRSHRSSWRST